MNCLYLYVCVCPLIHFIFPASWHHLTFWTQLIPTWTPCLGRTLRKSLCKPREPSWDCISETTDSARRKLRAHAPCTRTYIPTSIYTEHIINFCFCSRCAYPGNVKCKEPGYMLGFHALPETEFLFSIIITKYFSHVIGPSRQVVDSSNM